MIRVQRGGTVNLRDQVNAVSSNMISVQEQVCWLVCRLTSQSMHKDLFVRDLELIVNPDLEDSIKIEECIGCNISN